MAGVRFWWVAGIIFAAAISRLVPHPANFAPIGAMALFSGAHADRRIAFLLPFLAMFGSDLVIGLHSELPFVYGCFAINVLMGCWLRQRRSFLNVCAATLACALLFYVVTNFGVWLMQDGTYPKTAAGLATCYVAALPYFERSLLGDYFYTAVMFGGFALAERRFASLREQSVAMT
jgi:hypothetical protein